MNIRKDGKKNNKKKIIIIKNISKMYSTNQSIGRVEVKIKIE